MKRHRKSANKTSNYLLTKTCIDCVTVPVKVEFCVIVPVKVELNSEHVNVEELGSFTSAYLLGLIKDK